MNKAQIFDFRPQQEERNVHGWRVCLLYLFILQQNQLTQFGIFLETVAQAYNDIWHTFN